MGVQWDPSETRSEKGDVQVQYKPESDRVVNAGYRFRRDYIEQVDGSVAWPISDNWRAYARMVYSLRGRASARPVRRPRVPLVLLGIRAVARRYVSSRTGDTDTSFLLQLELNGLSSVGVGDELSWNGRFGDTPPAPPEPAA